VYRGGTWLSPFHRMVPLPRSLAADAHGCIMVVGRLGPTEYKVVARWIPRPWHGFARVIVSMNDPALWAGRLGMLRVKARADARPLRGLRP
jgi:hypothetical protein